MKVKIKYLGVFSSHTKIKEETIDFEGEALQDLFGVLCDKYGTSFKDGLIAPSGEIKISVLVNSKKAALETALTDGDLVEFIQHVYGG